MSYLNLTYTSANLPAEGSALIPPRAAVKDPLVAFALTTPATGAPVVTTVTIDSNGWIVDGGGVVRLYPPSKPTSVDAAYDQLNRLWIGYVCDGLGYLWWYDSLPAQFVTLPIGPAEQMFLLMDDVRKSALLGQNSTVVLFYTRAGVLYYRDQQDRFGVEYAYVTLGNRYVEQIGMNTTYRVVVKLAEDTYPTDATAWDVAALGPAPWYPLDTTAASSYVLQVVLESRVVAKTLKEAMASSGVVDIGLPVQYADSITSTPLGLITETTQTRDNLAGSGVTTISAG